MSDLAVLREHLIGIGPAVLGYSGGVDSAVLAVAGREALGSGRFLAVIGRSASYPEAQHQDAVATARRFDIPLLEIDTHELENPSYLANPVNRCYFCKTELWEQLHRVARERGIATILDGTNADDLGEHRPGLKAAAEQAVRSPLAELGWNKATVRSVAHDLGIPTWDAPASPCLSSRIRYGLAVTPERLKQVEEGEALLRRLGVAGDLRVRHHGERARIEANPDQFSVIDGEWPAIQSAFTELGFTSVERDARGYRRGGLLDLPVLESADRQTALPPATGRESCGVRP
ncbi:MAG TPA: ATP-dependent sacrificial sulfur transferase LarE [Gemmatimonadales bacterium]|nr:ATP-dependent sacrificial sulfur transferase LarE [Gemmatimonadales bacterium]